MYHKTAHVAWDFKKKKKKIREIKKYKKNVVEEKWKVFEKNEKKKKCGNTLNTVMSVGQHKNTLEMRVWFPVFFFSFFFMWLLVILDWNFS